MFWIGIVVGLVVGLVIGVVIGVVCLGFILDMALGGN